MTETKYGRCDCGGRLKSAGRDGNRVKLRCAICRRRAGSLDVPQPLPIRPDYSAPENRSLKGVSSYVKFSDRNQWILDRNPLDDKTRRELAIADAWRDIPDAVRGKAPVIPPPAAVTHDNLLAVYPLGDPHFGMLAWGDEVGQDYDLQIACDRHLSAVDYLRSQAPTARHALLILLGDTFHADDQTNRTPRSGNQLDVDSRFAKIARAVRDVTIGMIDRLQETHEYVTVWSVRGNHDPHSAYWLALVLDAYYSAIDRVSVDLSPGKFFTLQFGKTLIASTHGDSLKVKQLQGVLATDAPKQWGETQHRYWLTGHIHSTNREEFPGVVWESFRTLAGPDAHGHRSGYRSGQDAYRIVYSREHGEIGRHRIDSGMADYLAEKGRKDVA